METIENLETKNLKNKVEELRKLVKRINFENNLSYKELEEENTQLKEKLQQMKLAYTVLDDNCERFQRAINYWRYMKEGEEEDLRLTVVTKVS